MKLSTRMVVVLTSIGLLSGSFLATVGHLTKERIALNKQREIEDQAFRFGKIYSYRRYEPPHVDVKFDAEYYKIYFEGKFYNEGKRTKKNVTVIMSFYDSKGKWVAWRNAYTSPTNVSPGEKASFTIKIRSKYRFTTYDITAAWDY